MITCSNSPLQGSGIPNHYVGDLLPTIGISGLSRVRTELFELFVIPPFPPHPIQMHGQLSRHRDLGDLPSAAHGKVEKPVAPLRVTAYRDLRRFHQQKAQQCVALLADMSQPSSVTAGRFGWNQTYVAGDLLAAIETFGRSNHQLERQCRQWSDSGVGHQPPCHRTLLDFRLQSTS